MSAYKLQYKTQSRSRLKLFTLLSVVACVVLFVSFLFFETNLTFPVMSSGAYAGTVSGVSFVGEEKQSATIFFERIKGRYLMLVTVFVEGWEPQVVRLLPSKPVMANLMNGSASSNIVAEIPFQPVIVDFKGNKFTFSGIVKDHQYIGKVHGTDGTHGTWSVQLVNNVELSVFEQRVEDINFDWENFLKNKQQQILLNERLSELRNDLQGKQKLLYQMQAAVSNEGELRRRATEKYESVEQEVQAARENRKQAKQSVEALESELDMLGRITKCGKVVNLARKIMHREDKWYLANWGEEEDLVAAEEAYAAELNIEMSALEKAYKIAQEIQNLQSELAREKALFSELRNHMQERIAPYQQPQEEYRGPAQPPSAPPSKGRGLWDRLFG